MFGVFIYYIIKSKKNNFSERTIYMEIFINSAAASITMLAVQAEILKITFFSLLKTWQFDFMIVIFIISVWFVKIKSKSN
jgi:hypothetical protein